MKGSNPTACFIDSNIFLRLLVKDNPRQFNDCKSFFQDIRKGSISAFTSTIILTEVLWTLKSFYKIAEADQIEAISSILHLHGLQMLEGYDTSLALDYYKSHNIKYIDALIATIPQVRERKIALVSYDEDFDKLPVIRKEPQDFI